MWIMPPHSHPYFSLAPFESFSVDSMGMDDVQYKYYLIGYNHDQAQEVYDCRVVQLLTTIVAMVEQTCEHGAITL